MKRRSERRRIVASSILVLTLSSLLVGSWSILQLYFSTIERERANLSALVRSWGVMFETESEHRATKHTADVPYPHAGPVSSEFLRHITHASTGLTHIHETGEILIAHREGDSLFFHGKLRYPGSLRVPLAARLFVPMQRALEGSTGTVIAADYRGETVLAAYRPLSDLGLGLVAKVDMTEIREPFIRALGISAGIAFLIILVSSSLLLVKIDPIIKRLERSREQQSVLNRLLGIGLEDVPLQQKLLKCLDEVLSVTWMGLEQTGTVLLADDEAGVLRMAAQRNLSQEVREACSVVDYGHCLCGRAAESKKIQFASDLDERHDVRHQGMKSHGHYNVPLTSGGRLLGVLGLYLASGHQESAAEKSFLRSVAGALAGIIERDRAEEALRQSEERYSLAALGANDGLWDWDLASDRIYLSPRWKSMQGVEDDNSKDLAENWWQRIHPDDLPGLRSALGSHLAGHSKHFEHEYRMLHEDGTYQWRLSRGIAVRNDSGQPYRMTGSTTDISDRKHVEQQLLHDAFHDTLTQLPNRALVVDRLDQLLVLSKRHDSRQCALLYLDIDRFKVVNDSLGYAVGDQLLVAIAQRLRLCSRVGDTVGRLGGDEFVVLIQPDDAPRATEIAERIQQAVSNPMTLETHDVRCTASIGIAIGDPVEHNAEDLLRHGDIAMYQAKRKGGACHAIFSTEMQTGAVKRLALETHLRQAIEEDQIHVHFQPIVALRDARLCSFEALSRWFHPEKGWISPGEFIPVAEETGLIIPLGRQVLEQTCGYLSEWTRDYPAAHALPISVNLSPKQLADKNLFQDIRGVLDRTGLDPRRLRLELTENLIMENAGTASKLLPQLREMGIQLCLDDFGTGYSSLSYLHHFPLDILKIDRSFVARLEEGSKHHDLVSTIISIAHSFDMQVVAEGVETHEQRAQLNAMNCEYAQGYLFSKPLPAEGAAGMLSQLNLNQSEFRLVVGSNADAPSETGFTDDTLQEPTRFLT